ncbi:hypothetical protein BO83DRAFT_42744 [Aspergillus eucalypticola CBS 122712]|uniref:Uncharacterized protein n=1 Tax=Aspergillus eucalypticola (strain CBS 122712 / IBT 29274) TaxID=1448314 RepID=A0A317VFG6_ASPEC|nr:uncharacterized protein BO83DRAFT_42744 [Aspergillus eucalypticola CBS 122712]PWY71847.1 hypothetical protein BO83DRAFT_42744 [Aspergillus eucalypticola CBS 122712]
MFTMMAIAYHKYAVSETGNHNLWLVHVNIAQKTKTRICLVLVAVFTILGRGIVDVTVSYLNQAVGFFYSSREIFALFRGPDFKIRCQLSCVCTALMIDTWCQSRQYMSQSCPRLQKPENLDIVDTP